MSAAEIIDPVRRRRRQRIARALLITGFAALGLWVAGSFIHAVIWGLIIAVAIDPLYARAVERWPRHQRLLLPLVFTLTLLLAIVLPLAIGLVQAGGEAHSAAEWLKSARRDGIPLPDWAARLPFGRDALATWWQTALSTPEGAAALLDKVNVEAISRSRLLGAELLRRLIVLAFALLTLFFLLRDRDHLAEQFRVAGDKLFGPSGERVAHQLLGSVRGTINGLVLVGLGEGAVLAVAYFALGVPHPLLLGALTGVAAMIPLGAALVFCIAALLLLGQGAVGGAIAIVVIGLVVVAIADHLIRPVLIGGATRLPFLWVLIGIVGGVESLGVLGLFIGPATMAVLMMTWREFVGDGEPVTLPPVPH